MVVGEGKLVFFRSVVHASVDGSIDWVGCKKKEEDMKLGSLWTVWESWRECRV